MNTNPQTAIKRLIQGAQEPLEWEIESIAALPDMKDRFEALKLRKIPAQVGAFTSQADREVYIDLIVKKVGISVKAVEDLLEQSVDLYNELQLAFPEMKNANPLALAEYIYKWFMNGAGAMWFKTADQKVWLFYHGIIYEIDRNLNFETLMYRMAKLSAIDKPGAQVWYFLRTICNAKGIPIDMVSWLHTDRESETIYLNLNSPHSKILRVAMGEDPELINNGTNRHGVLLSSSTQIREFQYQPDASEAEGFSALKKLFIDTTPCEGPQRYFLLCFMISTFLMDYQGDRGLVQVIGGSKIGKSKVAERFSQLIYGANYVGSGSGAADVRIATRNPATFLDNIENRNLNQSRVDFLLHLANSSVKPKSKSGSDTEVLYQKLNSMGMITSIEPFPGKFPELINRTFPIIVEQKFKGHGYMHDETMRAILKNRNLMLSVILKMIGKSVLPRLEERAEWSNLLATTHAGHNKDRMNEHLCMMMLILEGVLEHIPWKKDVPIKKQCSMLLDQWIKYQEEQARDTSITYNTLLNLMDGLVREVLFSVRKVASDRDRGIQYTHHKWFGDIDVFAYEDPEYKEVFYITEPHDVESLDEDEKALEIKEQGQTIDIVIPSARLHVLFNRYCRNQATKNPFENGTALGSRIANDKEVMQKGGWTYISREGGSQWKKVMGTWYWRLSKRLNTGFSLD